MAVPGRNCYIYQLAKLRMLEFYYDFLDRYIDRRNFELIQIDTDSNYPAIFAECLEDIIRRSCARNSRRAKKIGWLGISGTATHRGSPGSSAKADE